MMTHAICGIVYCSDSSVFEFRTINWSRDGLDVVVVVEDSTGVAIGRWAVGALGVPSSTPSPPTSISGHLSLSLLFARC